ncbi:isoleucyl-tRNA synthetase [Xylariaceae sp. FL0016]|nr:isoleucyl-tRNA synthetase [Xylariaceae sp. FL0016]
MSKTWKATLRLPQSSFPPRPLPACRDKYLQRATDRFFEWQKQNRSADQTFVLHDGPPYANGNLHVGHALNKVLKDMILRVQVQQGKRVDYIPGWDCHGLPIELKALENTNHEKLTPLEIRKSARNLASNTVLKQMKSFRSFGIMSDWDKRWTTMDAAYEMRQLRLFQKMVNKDLIHRRFKPVYWSPSSRTALAEAELEYKDDHVSKAAWIKFRIVDSWRSDPHFQDLSRNIKGNLHAVIWTTTPWTLPANRAIAIHDDLEYCVVREGDDGLLVATSRLETLRQKLGNLSTPDQRLKLDLLPIVATIRAESLRGLQYLNRLRGKSAPSQPIIHADFVSADSGTGLVHLAPGHGFDDYDVCSALSIPASAPIDDQGKFTRDAFPDSPEALSAAPPVTEGGEQSVLELLQPYGDVILTEEYQHKYPYDWRTKQPVVIRATEQWFADVAHIKDEALQALDDVRFFPETGKKRLSSFIQGRSEWCISRQRVWGVPIPALYDETGTAIVTKEVVEHIISVIQERGTHAWWSDAADDPAWIPRALGGQGNFRRGTDTMDVWFDSGSSWTMLNSRRADLYLEGTDQHRGWFQSSLLTRIAAGTDVDTDLQKGAPFKQLITHGFTLDQEGKKMSKSLGNIIEPQEIMDGKLLPPMKRKGKAAQTPASHDALGADALRLWAASSDYTRDVSVGVNVLQAIHVALIKYRTTVKMLLGSVHESARTAPLTAADQIALIQLQDTMDEVGKAYVRHEFYKAFNALNRWITNSLSAFYLETLKDRLYCGDGGGVLEPILHGFLRMLAPMTPMLVEETWDHLPNWMKQDESLVHPLHQLYTDPLFDTSRLPHDEQQLRQALPIFVALGDAIKSALEEARSKGDVGSSLQSIVNIYSAGGGTDNVVFRTLHAYSHELASMFVVSGIGIDPFIEKAPLNTGVVKDFAYRQDFEVFGISGYVEVRPPRDHKCPRCWRHTAPKEEQLCQRCTEVVADMNI